MSTVLIVNIALDAVVFAVIVGTLVRAMIHQHRDRGVTLVSERHPRWTSPRRERTAPARPQLARGSRGQASPAG
jgi:hypothetical protein